MFWPFRKSQKPPKNTYMGVDLNQWAFLGTTCCTFTDCGKTVATGVVYLFCDRQNVDRRHFIVKSSYDGSYYGESAFLKSHPYILKYVIPWSMGGKTLSSVISDPSEWLKHQYKTVHNIVWDGKQWVKDSGDLDQTDLCIEPRTLEEEMAEFDRILRGKDDATN